MEEKRDEEEEERKRKSRDKIRNQKEKEVIDWIKENGLAIRNGNIRGDESQDFTYIGTGNTQ